MFHKLFRSQAQKQLDLLYEKGKQFYKSGNLTEALETFNKVLTQDPNCIGAKYNVVKLTDALKVSRKPNWDIKPEEQQNAFKNNLLHSHK